MSWHYCPARVKACGKAETGVMSAFICCCLMHCIGCRIEGKCESSGSSTPDHFVAPVLHIDLFLVFKEAGCIVGPQPCPVLKERERESNCVNLLCHQNQNRLKVVVLLRDDSLFSVAVHGLG